MGAGVEGAVIGRMPLRCAKWNPSRCRSSLSIFSTTHDFAPPRIERQRDTHQKGRGRIGFLNPMRDSIQPKTSGAQQGVDGKRPRRLLLDRSWRAALP
jgi:hypothetical protein